ncbi:aminotransferase class V-fold PLP-dependent enzyme [Clostridium sp. P21]|uniref:Aminotransferase class V-fold PLP-dependent enzyme n=1 Tax=Clostridium muellerianum TaxID=2716538 RepID=A0A7Y0EDS9_9CLOT|nr:aminotransferase class V-fold PLP-dependent enzyme [Clostridium muellerianum]NMM61644.1 aminotransferase class V-fold PLP-dependent enzyme [Clostridium muellerianum]
MSELPILEGILKYVEKDNIRFCTPGHKGGRGFLNTPIGKEFMEHFLACDITEVEGTDNLHNPQGIIKKSLELLTKFYGSKKSYFLVNGSTSGNLIMMFSSFKEGDKVLIERNCHRSIFNAIIMRKLKPVYVNNKVSDKLNAPVCIDLEHFLKVLDENKDAKGIVVTYPNYYGMCCNLKYVIEQARKYDIKVLVDAAHGAHFGIHKDLPKSAVKLNADMVVTSTHKTLSSLTQTSYLHVNNKEDIEKADFYVSAFSSTSPSYLFLGSMDYARYYLETCGEKEYEKLLSMLNFYRNKINLIEGINVISKDDVKQSSIYDIDNTRYVINLEKGYSGYLLGDYLRENNIDVEMSDHSNVVLIFSPFNEEWEIKKLYNVLRECDLNKLKIEEFNLLNYDIPLMAYMPFEVMDKKKEYVNIKNSLGRISAVNVVPYPPGVPIINMGEVISDRILNAICYYKDRGVDILGLEENKIEVIDEFGGGRNE